MPTFLTNDKNLLLNLTPHDPKSGVLSPKWYIPVDGPWSSVNAKCQDTAELK